MKANEAQRGAENAKLRREIIQAGTELERKGAALLKQPEVKFRSLDAILEALELGQDLKELVQREPITHQEKNLQDYPVQSPLTALRVISSSVLEIARIDGELVALSDAGQKFVASSFSDEEPYRLYDFSGREVAKLEGDSPRFSQNGTRLATTISDRGIYNTILYDLPSGGKIGNPISGKFRRFIEDSHRLITSLEDEGDSKDSVLYDLSGNEIGVIKGKFQTFAEDSQRIVTTSNSNDVSYLYDLDGNEIKSLKGRFHTFIEDDQKIVTTSNSNDASYLYDLDGNSERILNGQLVIGSTSDFSSATRKISSDGQKIITSVPDSNSSNVYDSNGKKITALDGLGWEFSSYYHRSSDTSSNLSKKYTGRDNYFGLVRFDGGESPKNSSIFYNLDSGETIELEGHFRGFSKHRKRFVFDKNPNSYRYKNPITEDDFIIIYDQSGNKIAEVQGYFRSLSQDGNWIIVDSVSSSGKKSVVVYDLDGKEISRLKGIFMGLAKDPQQFIVSSYRDENTYSYNFSGKEVSLFQGVVQTISRDWSRLVTTTSRGDISYLYDFNGNRVSSFEGRVSHLSQNGQYLFDSRIGRIKIYELSNRKLFSKVSALDILFSDDSQNLVVASKEDRNSRIYSLSNGETVFMQGKFSHFSNDGRNIITYSDAEDLTRVYDLSGNVISSLQGFYYGFNAKGEFLTSFDRLSQHPVSEIFDFSGNGISTLGGLLTEFNSNGQRLLVKGYSANDLLYSLSTDSISAPAAMPMGHTRISEDGQNILIKSGSLTLIYDLLGNQTASLDGEYKFFSKDGTQLVRYFEEEGLSRIYDIHGQFVKPEFRGQFIEFSPNTRYFAATVSDEDTSLVYDSSGHFLAEFPGTIVQDNFSGNRLGFSPDSTQIATQTDDGLYHLWQLDNGLDDLLARGCDWVRPYLQANPEEERAGFCRE